MRNSGDDMKKSILAVVVFAVALFAQADVLYWMVSDDLAATATSGGEASFAALYASDSDVALVYAKAIDEDGDELRFRLYPLGENEFGRKGGMFRLTFGEGCVTYDNYSCKKLSA